MTIDLSLLQRFAAIGITQSAVRLGKAGKDVIGMASCARGFCSNIDLENLPSPENYPKTLDEWTAKLTSEFPKGGRYWGTARKCINIFVRDASYNFHLRRAYPLLANLENVLEVPIDGYVAKGLLKEREASACSLSWDAIIRLTPDVHGHFQHLAQRVADRMMVDRVHLDIYYFRRNE
jgi:hypothetical protein